MIDNKINNDNNIKGPPMMQGAEMSSTLESFSTVGSYLTSGNDGSSFHVQKNKRTQTKSQVHRSVSDARSDQNDKLINRISTF